MLLNMEESLVRPTDVVYISCNTKFLREKVLVNLANRKTFTKFFLSKFFLC